MAHTWGDNGGWLDPLAIESAGGSPAGISKPTLHQLGSFTRPASGAIMTRYCVLATSLAFLASSAFAQSTLPAASKAALGQETHRSQAEPAPKRPLALAASYGKRPLSFEANRGQSDPQVKFLSRGHGYSLFLTDSAAVLALSKPEPGKAGGANTDVVRMEFAGANHGLRVDGREQLPGNANYFLGNDPAQWHSNIPTYAKVNYAGVYPGIDLAYYGNQRQLEFDFLVSPGADPKAIRLHFAGAEKVSIDKAGDLTVSARNGEITFHKPVIYQTADGRREPIEGTFALRAGNTVGFTLGNYDHSRELTIDPVLAYSTYFGGNADDTVTGLAVDSEGSAYITGEVVSTNFPVTPSAYQKANGFASNYVVKLNPAGSALAYSTYLGGGTQAVFPLPAAIAVDNSGNAYVGGLTSAPTFPVTAGAYHKAFDGGLEVFVTKLNPTGSGLVYSATLGDGYTGTTAIAVDCAGDVYLTGGADAPYFPTTPGAYQTTGLPYGTSYITKLNADGSALIYSTYFGGGQGSVSSGIAADCSGHAYVTGYVIDYNGTLAPFPTTPGALQTAVKSSQPGYVAEFKPDGSAPIYSTLLGETAIATPLGIAIDSQGDAYVVGSAAAKYPTTAGAFEQLAAGPYSNGFVSKLNPAGTALIYSTYLVGTETWDLISSIALDSANHAYVTGYAGANADYPVTPDAYQSVNRASSIAGANAFLTELNAEGTALIYSTYLGGKGSPSTDPLVALDSLGNVYLAGNTYATDFPVTAGAYQQQNNAAAVYGTPNQVISKFVFNGATTTTLASGSNPGTYGQPVTFSADATPMQGSGVPSGTVSFIVDGAVAAHAALDNTGHAEYSTSSLAVGPHTVVASYQGDPTTYSASTGALTETITGGQAATPTILPLGGVYRKATVTITSTTPGAVIYYTTDNTTPTTGSLKYTAPISVSATKTVEAIATLSGDTSSSVAAQTYTINSGANLTSTILKLSPAESNVNQPVTFTATVQAAPEPTPTGTVTFLHGDTVIATVPLTAGTASYTTSTLATGDYSITAIYTGSATDAVSQSPASILYVNP